MNNCLTQYIEECLIPRLTLVGLNTNMAFMVSNDIKNRLSAIIGRWDDTYFRQTLLLTGLEEANFYHPSAKLEVKSMVVVGIRNSLLEDLASTRDAAKKLGADNRIISDDNIKTITSDAIKFFSKVDLSLLSQENLYKEDNPYYQLQNKYPLAWAALREVNKMVGNEAKYMPIEDKNISSLTESNFPIHNTNSIDSVVLSGMDPTIDTKLMSILKAIENSQLEVFFSDSFKMVSRHPDKLFKIINFVLGHSASFVTFNYYLSNGYVAKRRPLLKPAHKDIEQRYKLTKLTGLEKKHQQALKCIRSMVSHRPIS